MARLVEGPLMSPLPALVLLAFLLGASSPPLDNPLARYKLEWTDSLKWADVDSVEVPAGKTADEAFNAAQEKAVARGGGVVYFPPGTYRFADTLLLKGGVVIRGADPQGVLEARDEKYDPPTKFEFPKYAFRAEGDGTPIASAFKGIELADPATASNCGVVNVAIERGHIHLGEGEEHRAGGRRVVAGCVLRNAAQAAKDVPDAAIGQHPWQRWTNRFGAAISVKSAEHLLIANNRIPKSGEESFLQKGYVLQGRKKERVEPPDGVLFDTDNRPGIAANDCGLGGGGADDPNGTPETHPWGFRKGMVIRDNYIFATGRCAITFTGDGVYCGFNVIRFAKDVVRWTATGKTAVGGTGTNDNRAVQMRGWRWTLEGNDYEVWRNKAGDTGYYINDGEGLMHEDHVNSTVLDSKLIGNKGNSYLSIYKCAGIDGLLVQGNEIRTSGGIEAIFVVANRNKGKYPCRNVSILDNVTAGSGIVIAGEPAEKNVVRGNRHEGPGGKLKNEAGALCEGNRGYE